MTSKEKEKIIRHIKQNSVLPSTQINLSVDKYCEAGFFGFPSSAHTEANPVKDCLTQSLKALPQKHPIYHET